MTYAAFPDQIELFDNDSAYWWKEGGSFDLLHAMNPLRLSFISECVGDVKEMKILDVGCGGGILAEPLARLGASVTGIDASLGAITAATKHAEMMALEITYIHTTLNHLKDNDFDLVIASEIIEHVPDPKDFLAHCCQKLKPANNGIILSTINRTPKSYLGAILGAEYLLNWVPRGTHEWNRFLKPSDIDTMLRENMNEGKNNQAFSWRTLRGLSLNIRNRQWAFSDDLSINYIGHLTHFLRHGEPA
jgi:2-polyprenyl-6-hydroxyphenyl methylase/3-demethylubiquinone-9 3-methyltransferase